MLDKVKNIIITDNTLVFNEFNLDDLNEIDISKLFKLYNKMRHVSISTS